ncbi:MAG: beta-galactosidase [Acidobacteriota bacterium]
MPRVIPCLSVVLTVSLGLLSFRPGPHWQASSAEAGQGLRISTWYWLNSTSSDRWEADFHRIAEAGFTDVVLCWGLHSDGVLLQKEATRRALDWCAKAGLGGYLLVWHPTANGLSRRPEYQQVDNHGNRLFSFNLYHPGWRATQWKDYLQSVARTYREHPALAGYLFDDTFMPGRIGSFRGATAGDFVSYAAGDAERFRRWLQSRYQSLERLQKAWGTRFANWADIRLPRKIEAGASAAWADWCAARAEWLEAWALDTVRLLREVDGDPRHEIYLEDTRFALGMDSRQSQDSHRPITVSDTVGLDFGRVARRFDAVCGYTFFRWEGPNALSAALEATTKTLTYTRERVSDHPKLIYTFWVSDADLDKPLPLTSPTAEQIIAVAEAALGLGLRHVDYYGYRIGDWRTDEDEWERLRPISGRPYPLTRPLQGRFLCDRPEVMRALKTEHLRLKQRYR